MVILCHVVFVWCQFGEHSYFVWTDLIPEPYARIPSRTSTFKVKAWDPTRPFNKPILTPLVYSMSLSCLCLDLSSMPTLCGVLDDACPPRSHHGIRLGPRVVGWAPLESRRFSWHNVRSQLTLFIVRLWHSPSLKLVIVLDELLRGTTIVRLWHTSHVN